jgi:hypothetical protein
MNRIVSCSIASFLLASLLAIGGTSPAALAAEVGEPKAQAEFLALATAATPQADLAAAADRLATIPAAAVIPALDAFAAATPRGANWLRSGLDRAADRLGGELAPAALAAFVADPTRPPRGRVLAFSWLQERAPDAAATLLEGLLDDPALDLRREAVERLLESAASQPDAAARDTHRQALAAARDVDQVERIVGWLAEHGDKLDVADVLGFVRQWRVSDAFDNAGGAGFAMLYPPESALPSLPDSAAWTPVASTDRHGAIDLNTAIVKKKGVLAYALAVVEMPVAGPAEVRIGSPCAVSVWVNGLPVMSHEIYHASDTIDQYVAATEFRTGANTVLVKCCQNEQTQPWAEDWKFQLRITDALGKPLATQPRPEQTR